MERNNLIIFSKNRASQLHLLLESIYIRTNNLFDKITVLYKTNNNGDEYDIGYDKLISYTKLLDVDQSKRVSFVKETNFRKNLLDLISNNEDFKFTTFLVDDIVIFKDIFENKEEILNNINDDVICFSLRLGYNCNYSHPANMNYTLGVHEIVNNCVVVDYTKQSGDFNYPLSTDGHIFKTTVIKSLLQQISFYNPNTLEAGLQYFVRNRKIPLKMISFKESRLVSVPVNLVNDTIVNRHGLEFMITEKELNNRYLLNEIIDYYNLNFDEINGPHKEINYKFKKI